MKKFLFLLIILLSFNTVLSLDIYNCGILGKGNTIYVLKNNIFSSGKTCIEIVASNVTLDCQGHKIEGVGGPHSSYGIDIGTSNVSIKNCTITRWSMGIYFNGSSGSKIEGNQLENNIYGIHLMYSSSNTIEGNQLENNIYGIRLEDSSSNTIEGNQLENNNYGIRLEDSSSNTIEGNQLENNIYGIRLEGGGNNIIINNIISSSSGTGIEIFASDGNRIYNNFFNNTQNAKASHWQEGWKTRNYWNTTKTQGKRVYGPGKYIGGNYWTTPGGPGHSDSCTDDGDCFCKEPYSVVGDENKDNLPLIPCWRICPQKSCYTENGNQYKVSNVDPNGPYSCNEYEGCRYSEIQKCEGASDTDGGENYTTNGTCIRIKSCEDGECKQETFNDKCKSGAPSEVDLDPNGKIDIKDIAIVARAFGSKPGDTNWDPDADLDNNSIVNIIDIAKVAKEFGNSVGGGYLIEYYAFRDDCYNKLIDCSDVIGPGWHCEDGACVPCKSNLDCPTDSAIFTGCSKNRCVREGYYWHWECNTTTGFCDPKEIPYSVDVSEGKVCISNGLEVNATYAYNCKGDYTRVPKCSENSCSGYWYYAECDGYGNCDEDAKKFFEKSEQINASRGEVFDINCNSVLGNCSYERGCKGTCTAGNQWKACDGSGKCNVLLDIWEDLITCSPYLCQDGRCTDICERDCYGYMGSEDCDGKKVGDPCPGENRKECKDDCDGPKFCDYPLDFTYCPRKCTSNCVCDCTPPDCPPPTCVCSPACRGYECSSGTQQCTEKDCCIGTQTCIDCKWGSCDPPYAAGPCVAPEETCDIRDCTCRGGP